MLTAVFNIKFQMLGGSPSGLMQQEILDLINKMNPPVQPCTSDLGSLGDKPLEFC